MNDLTNAKHRKFVELLYRRTADRGMTWEINSQFQIYSTIAGGTLFMAEGVNGEGEDTIVFKLFGGDGKITDNFSDDSLRYDREVPAGFGNWYLLCSAMYEMAKRQATGADNVLDAMIAELDDDIPF